MQMRRGWQQGAPYQDRPCNVISTLVLDFLNESAIYKHAFLHGSILEYSPTIACSVAILKLSFVNSFVLFGESSESIMLPSVIDLSVVL